MVVAGREGQVARALAERGPGAGVEVIRLGRPGFDLLRPDDAARAIEAARPDVVVNAAAFTAVDKAEAEPGLAMQVNADGAAAVAAAAARIGAPLLQLSTDYVFDGALARPYREDDATAPLNAYGRSKLAGEEAALRACPRAVVVRTAWVYSPFGANFLKTMLRLGLAQDGVRVVADQCGSPTSALDLADALIAIAREARRRPGDRALYGVVHVAAPDFATWAEFAKAIFQAAHRLGRRRIAVEPILAKDYPLPARRPANSRLDAAKLEAVYGHVLPSWRASVRACVARLVGEAEQGGRSR